MEVVDQKKELRKMIASWSNSFPVELKRKQEQEVFAILERIPQFVSANRIGCYWSMNSEFNTHSFVEKWSSSKNIYLPRIENNEIAFGKFDGSASLVKGNLAAMEPTGETIDVTKLDLLIVPGMGFTIRGERIGRGGGFYDRLLRMHNCYSVALCYDFQMITELPLEEHDERVDLVLNYRG